MEQKIYYGETLVYSTSDRNTKFHNITLKRKAGSVPSLTFTVESGGSVPTPRSTVVNAYIDNTKVFSGVATNITSGFYNENTVVCEGLATCLNEVVIQELKMRKTYTNKNETTVYLDGSYVSDDTLIICEEYLYQQLRDLQNIINGQLDQDKQVSLEIRNSTNHPTWSTTKKRVKLDFERGSAMELISAIAEQSGCSLLFDNYTIAFVPEDYTLGASSQEIAYSENLLDLTNEVDYGTVASICIPYGAYWSDSDYAQAGLEGEDWHRINLKDLYGNSNYPNIIRLPVSLTGSTSYIYGVVNRTRQSAYGNVIVNKVFEDVTDFASLYNQAELYLNSLTGAQTININAIDTSGSGDIAPYKTIIVNAVPQGIEVSNLRIVESDVHFGEPEKDTLTIGVSGQTLTNNVNTVTPEMAGQITNIVREKVIEQVRQNIPDEVVRGYYNGADQIMYAGFNYTTGEFSGAFSGRGDTVYLAYAPYYKNAGLDAYDLLEGGDSFQILLTEANVTETRTVTELLPDGTTQNLTVPPNTPIRWTYDIELGEVSGDNIHYVLGIIYNTGGYIGEVRIMPVNELTGEAIRFSSGDGRTCSYTKSGKVTINGTERVIQPVSASDVVMYNQGYESSAAYPLAQWSSYYTDTEVNIITTKTDSIYYYTSYSYPYLVDTDLNANAGYVNTDSELYLYQQATGKWTLDKAKLDNYYTKYETSNLLAEKLDVTELASALSGYVKTIKIGDTSYSVDENTTNITLPAYESGAEVNVQSDWSVTDVNSDAYIKNKPTIPTVNNATLTIQKNGTSVGTFTANASTNKSIDITVPTKTSDITNDSGYLSSGSKVSVSGNPVEVSNNSKYVDSGTISFSPSQELNGYDKPWVGGGGKNLFNFDAWKSASVFGGTMSVSGNSFTLTATSDICYTGRSESDFPEEAKIYVSEGETFTLSWSVNDTNISGRVFIFPDGGGTSGKNNVNASASEGVLHYTAESGVTYFSFRFDVYDIGDSLTYSNIQIEKGSSATSYAPYENICPITGYDELNLNLYANSTDSTPTKEFTFDLGGTRYGGTLNFVTGELVVDRAFVDFSTNHIAKNDGVEGNDNYMYWLRVSTDTSDYPTEIICSHAPTINGYPITVNGVWGDNNSSIGHIVFINLLDAIGTNTVSGFRSYCVNNNVQLCYKLSTPITTYLIPHLIGLLSNYNYITTDGDSISLDYWLDDIVGELADGGNNKLPVTGGNVTGDITFTNEYGTTEVRAPGYNDSLASRVYIKSGSRVAKLAARHISIESGGGSYATRYARNEIVNIVSDTQYTLSLPKKDGTFALTNDFTGALLCEATLSSSNPASSIRLTEPIYNFSVIRIVALDSNGTIVGSTDAPTSLFNSSTNVGMACGATSIGIAYFQTHLPTATAIGIDGYRIKIYGLGRI